MSSILIRPLAALGLMLWAAGPLLAQDAETSEPAASEPAAKPKPRKPAPAKPAAVAKPAAPAVSAAVWPAGANSVSEVYGDWTVTCIRAEAKTACTLTQAQGAKGRREFGIEVGTPAEGRAQGMILMPLGLSLEPGISFKLDEAVLGKGAPFLACSQEGCLVPISLPTLATDTMKTAQKLLISATKPDAKDPLVITVPLTGFAPALARAGALSS